MPLALLLSVGWILWVVKWGLELLSLLGFPFPGLGQRELDILELFGLVLFVCAFWCFQVAAFS